MLKHSSSNHTLHINLDIDDYLSDIECSDLFTLSDRTVRLSNEFKSLLDHILSKTDFEDLEQHMHVDLTVSNISKIACDIVDKNWKGLLARGATKKDRTYILLKSRLTDYVRNYIENKYIVSVNISNNRKHYPC